MKLLVSLKLFIFLKLFVSMKLFVSGCCVLLEIYSLGNKSSAHFIFASKSRNGKFLNQMNNTFFLHKICLNNLVMWRNSAQLLLLPLSIDVQLRFLVICQANPPLPRTFSFRDIPLTDLLRTLWLSSRYLSDKCASHTFASAHFDLWLPSIDLIKTTLGLFIHIKHSISKGKLLRVTF